MQYDKYENRIKVIAKLLKLMFKHMTKILISLGVITVAGVALLATRGIIVSAESCPVEMTYGEELGYSAKAFLSDTGYEYSLLGSKEWTRELPRVPGEYNVRAVAKATFGYRYGDVQTFTLKPKPSEVVITSSSVVYGELPDLSLDLAYGDTVSSYSVSYNEDKTVGEVDLSTVKIVDKDGRDVTECYSFTTQSASLKTTKRPLSIRTESASKIYDGSPLLLNEYNVVNGSVAEGDRIEMTFGKSIISVGSVDNESECIIYDASGNDVTEFYNLTVSYGSLDVSKRPILIKTDSLDELYNGAYQSAPNYTVEGEYGIASTDTVTHGDFPALRYIGTQINKTDFDIINSEGKSVKSNYTIDFEFGVLTISKRPIVLKTESKSEVYNGKYLSREEYTIGGEGVAQGDAIYIDSWASIIDAGSVENRFIFTIRESGESDEVLSNYDITYEWGTLEISKKPLKITTPTSGTVYNGVAYVDTAVVTDGLIEGDELSVSSYAELKEVGSTENSIVFEIVNALRNATVTDNYDIDLSIGTLTVTKRPITLETKGGIWQYDGSEYSNSEVFVVGGDGIAPSQRYEVVSYAKITDVGKIKNEVIVAIFDGDDDVTDNYDITYNYGELEIYGRDIVITTGTRTEYYNGKVVNCLEAEYTGLSPLHTFKIISGAEITNHGEIDNVLVFDIVDDNGDSVKKHYNITEIYGKITVKKRTITVTTGSRYEVYTGYAITSSEWTISDMGLADGHTLSAPTPNGQQTNIGVSNNTYVGDVLVLDENDEDVTDNYIITVNEGTLEVIKRPVMLSTNGYNNVYDGKEFRDDTVNALEGEGLYDLCDGHYIKVNKETVKSFLNAMSVPEQNIFEFEIVDANGNNVEGNYDILDVIFGEVYITKRPVILSTNGYEDVYNGKEFRDDTVNVLEGEGLYDLCEGHTISKLSNPPIFLNAMSRPSENYFVFEIVDAEGKNVEANYEVERIFGEVYITKRPIKITTEGYNDVYNGKAFSNYKITVVVEDGYYAICDGEELRENADSAKSFLNAMAEPEKNSVEYGIYIAGTDVAVTYNYEIEEIFGEVHITKRPIKITTEGYNDVYNGKAFSNYKITVVVEDGYYAICDGEELRENTDSAKSFLNAMAEPEKNSVEYGIYFAGTDVAVTYNYEIKEDFGEVHITKRPIKITTEGYNDVYSGVAFKNSKVTVVAGNGYYDICEGQELRVDEDSVKSFLDAMEEPEKNAVSYEIYIVGTNDAVTVNYEIEEDFGEVYIAKRPIKITTEGYKGVYSGVEFKNSKVTVVAGNGNYPICEGQELRVDEDSVKSFLNAMAEPEKNSLEYDIYIVGTNEAVTENYEIEEIFGEVHITKRPLKVATNGYKGVYNGIGFSSDEIKILTDDEYYIYGLCTDQKWYVDEKNVPVFKNHTENEEEPVLNKFAFEIHDANGDNVIDNYDITCEYGKIEISRREIGFATTEIKVVYDGKQHSDGRIWVTKGSLCEVIVDGVVVKHEARPTSQIPSFKDYSAQKRQNKFTFEIYDEENTVVTDNYKFDEPTYGEVVISKRPIELTTETCLDVEYDGEYHGTTITPLVDDALCENHEIWVDYDSAQKNVTNGAVQNKLVFEIVDSNATDVTANYDIKINYGTVKIDKRYVYVTTGSYSWPYDGKEHKYEEFTFRNESSFASGHTVKFTAPTFVKNVSSVDNEFTIHVYDEDMYEVTDNYEIKYEYGTLTITRCVINVTSASKKKVYDGTPLFAHEMILASGSSIETLPAGYKIVAEFYPESEITEVGEISNEYDMWFSVDILDENGDSVLSNYKISNYYTGKLKVLPKETTEEIPEDEEDVFGKGFGDRDGGTDIGLPPDYDEGEASKMVLLIVTPDSDSKLYLKHKSYGDYTGSGWMEAIQYNKYINNVESAYYLPIYALQDSGIMESCVKIESPSGDFVLPYYSTDKGDDIGGTQSSDVTISGYPGDGYTVYYYKYDIDIGYSLPAGLVQYEKDYYDFVYGTYLQIDNDTKDYMQTIIDMRMFDKNDPDIINKVAKYIQNAAKYSFDYNRELDASSNIAVDFLSKYKEGVCQHYATAATMLFRALDIPARYTVGYVVDAEADTRTEVTALMKHAWVEVYIEGFGWVNVEVTGGGSFGKGINGSYEYEQEADEPIKIPKLMIWPAPCLKTYDGKALTYSKDFLNGNTAFSNLIKSGYTYTFKVSGSQTEIGQSTSTIISFTLYDKNKNPVPEEDYEVIFSTGTLTVQDLTEIKIYVNQKNYVYNGSPYTYASGEWVPVSIPKDISLQINSINISLQNVGQISSWEINLDIASYINYTVYDATGANVTKNYRLVVANYPDGGDYTVITVTQREIKIKTDSATKVYDGEPLKKESYTITFGKLCDGHWVSMTYTGSITVVGSTENRVARDIKIYAKDENGSTIDVTDNYSFPTPEFGTLTVTGS